MRYIYTAGALSDAPPGFEAKSDAVIRIGREMAVLAFGQMGGGIIIDLNGGDITPPGTRVSVLVAAYFDLARRLSKVEREANEEYARAR